MPNAHVAGEPKLAHKDRCEPVDESWIDDVVRDLFHTLKHQLSRFQKAGRHAHAGQSFANNARMLVAIEHALERLLEVEKQRETQEDIKTLGLLGTA